MKTKETVVAVKPPKFELAEFRIIGVAPLVIHRFSEKAKLELKQKMETGKAASSKKNREAKSSDELFEQARYVSPEGWDGVHAAAFRNALIDAMREAEAFQRKYAMLSELAEVHEAISRALAAWRRQLMSRAAAAD